MRLIDADALEPDTEWDAYYDGFLSYSQSQIDAAPTIEPEVQLAHWIPGKRGKWICSCCGNEIYCTSADDLQRNHEFCGHCGAEMKDQCDMRTLIEEAIL